MFSLALTFPYLKLNLLSLLKVACSVSSKRHDPCMVTTNSEFGFKKSTRKKQKICVLIESS